ncbi:MAG TPA: ATP-binding protein, partial [Gemmatimonadales bacterium]|nr:ATP-binding protein [Gemmatimonadales bacterium]
AVAGAGEKLNRSYFLLVLLSTRRPVALAASAAVVLAGTITLLGWSLGIDFLKRGIGDGVAMNPATATCFILAGLALFLLRIEPAAMPIRRFAIGLAITVGLIALVRLAGYLFDTAVGIDQLLFSDQLADAIAGRPNRMAPNTAVAFLGAGIALLTLDVETRRGLRPAQLVSIAISLLALQALLGYAYGGVFLIKPASFIPMAFNTATAFLVLSVGMIAARPGRGILALPARWSLRRRVNLAFGGALVVLMLSGIAAVWTNFHGTAAARERGFANRRRFALLRLESLIEGALRGERGYLLTGDSVFLRPYRMARDSLPAVLSATDALFDELPAAALRFGALRPVLERALGVFSNTIELHQAGNRTAALTIVRRGDGRVLMDSIRTAIGGMLADDEARAGIYDLRAQRADRLALLATVGVGLLAVLLLLGGTLTINRDITKREEAEAALRSSESRLADQYRRLQELEALRDNLVHMLVHDLRSPLTALRANLDFARLGVDSRDADLAETLDDALTATTKMTEMVSDVLDVSRLESGQMPLQRTDTDLALLAAEAVALVGASAGGGRVQLEALRPGIRARCDADLIRRVIANLVANAMKFTPPPPEGSIVVRIDAHEGLAQVSVVDSGSGIPAEYHDRIFEKFGQVEAKRAGAQRSSGLGLTFCKLAVEAHGGVIGVQSGSGRGSVFTFTLPDAGRR